MRTRKLNFFEGTISPILKKKTLRKAIKITPKLKTKQIRLEILKISFSIKIQRNFVVKLNRQYKLEHFRNLNPFHGLKYFWKTCRPCFSSKHSFIESKIVPTEKSEIMTKSSKVSKTCDF